MSPTEVLRLPSDEFFPLWDMITVLEAQETLLNIKILSYPHLKPAKQKEIHKQLMKDAFPRKLEKKKAITLQEFAKIKQY